MTLYKFQLDQSLGQGQKVERCIEWVDSRHLD